MSVFPSLAHSNLKTYSNGHYDRTTMPNGTVICQFTSENDLGQPTEATSGSWTPYVIGRDYLGSITHIATADGTLVEERSYDAQ